MNHNAGTAPTLRVWWTVPPDLAVEGPILSFLGPADEDRVIKAGVKLIFARELAGEVIIRARARYLDLAAQIGVAPAAPHQTFRQALKDVNGGSAWWYHPISFKDCESSPVFEWILAVSVIQHLCRRLSVKRLSLVGCPEPIGQALRSHFDVVTEIAGPRQRQWTWWIRGVASRVRYLLRALHIHHVLRRHPRIPPGCDAALVAFWGWSLTFDPNDGVVRDKYLGGVGPTLRANGTPSCWLAWFDPFFGPDRRPMSEVAKAVEHSTDIFLLQRLLRLRDYIVAIATISPLRAFLRAQGSSAFRAVFRQDGVDYFPIFREELMRGLLDATLPHHRLVETAWRRAAERQPFRLVVTFLEHFPYTRALITGVKRAHHSVQVCAVQHASYGSGKTFLFLDESREFSGSPDGCAVPKPDLVCAMGTLGQELFLKCGYSFDAVVVTGSPRYEWPMELLPSAPRSAEPRLKVLLLTSLSESSEKDFIEAAWVAANGLPDVLVRLRPHPMAPFNERSWFRRFERRISLATGTLTDALADADVVLHTYSTAADEAWVAGKCVWLWASLQFRGSALIDVVSIPTFSSVESLREAFRAGTAQRPVRDGDPAEVERVRAVLFGPLGMNAGAVVNALKSRRPTDEAPKRRRFAAV